MSAVAERIAWKESLDEARERTARHGKPVLIDFSAAPTCEGCVAMDTVTYPDTRVSNFIQQDCVPVRVAVKDNPELVDQYLVGWTPNVVIVDERGRVHYRVEGYLPPEEFVGRLSLGVGKFLLLGGRVADAAARFEGVAARHPGTAEAAEALYWLGVAHYKRSDDFGELRSIWDRLAREFPDSEWSTRTRIPSKE